jgi:hypothetical protein
MEETKDRFKAIDKRVLQLDLKLKNDSFTQREERKEG